MSAKRAKPEPNNKSQSQTPVLTQATVHEADIQALVHGYHGAPFAILGPHLIEIDGVSLLAIRAFRPLDAAVFVVDTSAPSTVKAPTRWQMQRWGYEGFFEVILPAQSPEFRYKLVVADEIGKEYELADPYRFPPLLTE